MSTHAVYATFFVGEYEGTAAQALALAQARIDSDNDLATIRSMCPDLRAEVTVGSEPRCVPTPVKDPCPRCGEDKGAGTRLVCPTCWDACPANLRRRWGKALLRAQGRSKEAQAIVTWAQAHKEDARE